MLCVTAAPIRREVDVVAGCVWGRRCVVRNSCERLVCLSVRVHVRSGGCQFVYADLNTANSK